MAAFSSPRNWGWGFHSNDARGAVQTRDPKTGDPVDPVDPIVRAEGAEVGARTVAHGRFHSSAALWILDIASELVFVGDAGTTEASRPSRRLGFEWSNTYTPTTWLALDADVAYSKARFRDQDPAGDRIPGAVEGVVSAGVTVEDRGPWSGTLRLRYFGPRPLIEDNAVRSKASTTLNARLSYRLTPRYSLTLDAFNLTNSKASDIDYYYTSRLPGESLAGVDDIHTHPLEPFTLRASFTASFWLICVTTYQGIVTSQSVRGDRTTVGQSIKTAAPRPRNADRGRATRPDGPRPGRRDRGPWAAGGRSTFPRRGPPRRRSSRARPGF